jgi:hypothetical protein
MHNFADVCEEMAGMMSMLPARHAPELDRAAPTTRRWHAVADHAAHQGLLNPFDKEFRPMPTDLSRPVRSALINDFVDTSKPYYAGYGFRAARALDLRAAGRIPFPSPQPTLVATIAILRALEPTREIRRAFTTYHPKEQRWICWGGPRRELERGDDFDRMVNFAVSMQFSQRYTWRVLLGYGRARVALDTNGAEARKLFAARDLPAGRERRSAIRHWVTEHYREAGEVPVRSHFRGAELFAWDGMTCEVVPSEYDSDRVGAHPRTALPKAGDRT